MAVKGTLEQVVFSPAYRKMVSKLKKLRREELRDEGVMNDFRTSEGKGRKGPADMQAGLSTRRHTRRNSRKKPGPVNNEAEENRDTGSDLTIIGEV